jgi:AcrR family transcriptional regulator
MLAAMAEACAAHGAARVTVAHVVGRSGVSRRTFYEIFDGREACFVAAMEDGLAKLREYVLPAYEAHETWLDRIRASLRALLEFVDDEPLVARLLVVETLGGGVGALERRRGVLAAAAAALDGGRQESAGGRSLPPLTAEGAIGGVLSVLHDRMLEPDGTRALDLVGQLTSMLVLPYLGAAVAAGELRRKVRPRPVARALPANPLRGVAMRLTYRTVRVLCAVAEHPGASNREVGLAAGVADQGQISRLLTRLHRLGLIEKAEAAPSRGVPNAWRLTEKGAEMHAAVT